MAAAKSNGVALLAQSLIDVWDVKTFDPALLSLLTPHIGVAVDYFRTDHQILLAHDLGRGPARSLLRPDNPHARAFQAFGEGLIGEMAGRAIRAWHYARMTDAEIEVLRRDDPHLSTPATLRGRLNALVTVGDLSASQAAALYAPSPLHTSQLASRQGNSGWCPTRSRSMTAGSDP